jgi:hypothetical protein
MFIASAVQHTDAKWLFCWHYQLIADQPGLVAEGCKLFTQVGKLASRRRVAACTLLL